MIQLTDAEWACIKRVGGGFNYDRLAAANALPNGRFKASVLTQNSEDINEMVNRVEGGHDIPPPPVVPPPVPPPPTSELIELPAWSWATEFVARRISLKKGEVYTMRIPAPQSPLSNLRASLAIVPAGSGSVGGELSLLRGLLSWDGTGGSAGGSFSQTMAGVFTDTWFTFRLGSAQPDTDVNALVMMMP